MNRLSCCIITYLSFLLLPLAMSSCSNLPSSSTQLDPSLMRPPHLALAPLKVSCKSPTPWNLGDEVGCFIERELQQSGDLKISSPSFLRSHQRVPPSSLWHSKDLVYAKRLLPHDFIALLEITQYDLIKDQSQGLARAVRGAQQTKPYLYEVQVYVRLIDLTGPSPKIAFQELFRFKVPVSSPQVQTDETLKDWTQRRYFSGAYAAVTAKLSSVVAKSLEERILQAWTHRIPASRYPNKLHSKL